MNIKIKKLNSEAKLPFRATFGSAGADLFACLEADIVIASGERKLIPTGLSLEIPEGFGGFVFPRSSLASKHGISLSNCVGVIDSDYRGELKVALINHSSESFTIKNGDRIAQFVIIPVCAAEFTETQELTETKRGEGGFGSTGKI
jgi:dUTP pyrophosphatase